MKLIEAEALKNTIRGWIADVEAGGNEPAGKDRDETRIDALEDVISHMDSMTAIDAEPVKHGTWERSLLFDEDGNVVYIHRHKECNYENHGYKEHGPSYCPNCGAKMDLREGGSNAAD